MKDLSRELIEIPCFSKFRKRILNLFRKKIRFEEIGIDHLAGTYLSSGSLKRICLLTNLNEMRFMKGRIKDPRFLRSQAIELEERCLSSENIIRFTERRGNDWCCGKNLQDL